MIDNAELEDYAHFTEDIIEFIVNKCIISDKMNATILDRVFVLIDKFLQKNGTIYVLSFYFAIFFKNLIIKKIQKIARQDILFRELFRLLSHQHDFKTN